MAEFIKGATKPNGNVVTGLQALTSKVEYIVIQTNADIRMATQSGGSAASQARLDKLIQIVATRGQPVIIGNVGTGTVGTYVIVVANEHFPAWQTVDGIAGTKLFDRIVADGYNYTITNSGLAVNFCASLTEVAHFFG